MERGGWYHAASRSRQYADAHSPAPHCAGPSRTGPASRVLPDPDNECALHPRLRPSRYGLRASCAHALRHRNRSPGSIPDALSPSPAHLHFRPGDVRRDARRSSSAEQRKNGLLHVGCRYFRAALIDVYVDLSAEADITREINARLDAEPDPRDENARLTRL